MDLHISPTGEISLEDLIEKHQADLATQHKYEVNFKGVWVNKDNGMVFCLMEGPDKEACVCVHQEAHGDKGCNVVEVSPADFNAFLSSSLTNQHDIAEIEEGYMDTGYRTLLYFEWSNILNPENSDINQLQTTVKRFNGKLLLTPQPLIRAVFVKASQAVNCASDIIQSINSHFPGIEYRMVVATGNPVDENHDTFYGYTTELSERLSKAGYNGCVWITQLTLDLFQKESDGKHKPAPLQNIKVLSQNDERFLYQVVGSIEKELSDATFNVSDLARLLLLSRTQLYRKIKQHTGYTPNALIREIRLNEALKRLRQDKEQIAQIAYDTGFNSHSYFSKMFASRYKMLPSDYVNSLEK